MTIRTALWASVGSLALCATGAAAATTTHRHKAVSTRTANSETRELREQVEALRTEVEALKTQLTSQTTAAGTAQAQVQTAQSQLQATQTQIEAVQAKADATQAQVAAIPAQVQQQVATEVDKTRHADKFYFKGITVTPGGFLELAGIYRQHQMGNDISTSFGSIPFDNSRQGHTSEGRLTARQSRVSFLAEGSPDANTHLAMYGEFDFQGAAQTANSNESNSYNPRIRTLYGTWDHTGEDGGLHLLVGQNWSLVTLNSKGITPRNEVPPAVIDAQYVPGFTWARQPQVRLTADALNHTLWFALSAENPQTTFYTVGTPAGAVAGTAGTAAALPGTLVYNIGGGSGFNSANSLSLNHVPDIIGKVAYDNKVAGHQLHLEAYGLWRSFNDRFAGGNDTTHGEGVGGGATLALIPGVLDLEASGLWGKGVGRYGTSQLPDVTFAPDGSLKPVHEWMLLAGGVVHAGKMLDIYGYAGEEHDKRRAFTTAAGLAYGYGNPLYTNAGCDTEGSSVCVANNRAVKQLTVGFWQKIYQGSFGRAQIGAQYSYTERDAFDGVGGSPEAKQNIGFFSFRYYPF